ncbi:MAG: oxidoreductase, short chain dehydrogenase/reductase family [Flavipsychrobacter sp.]|jgi:short-subunit dehydrogenase|nr:oxidoreductase, short chain dehydrogenase/reductase family [Flavipsychrobacter sp.]
MPSSKYTFIEHLLFPSTSLNERKLSEKLKGKTVLITGASYGIGEQVAYRLAQTGARLLLVARTEEKLKEVRDEVARRGGEAHVFIADLAKEEQVKALLVQLLQWDIDIVISNAGKSIRRSVYESLDRFHDLTRSMGVNYFGPARLVLALIPMLEKNKGHIINVSAVNVLLAPAPYWAAYQSSKTAFDQWFRCAAPELRAAGICTTSVYLPLVKTRMIAPTAAYNNMPAMSAEHAAAQICMAITTRKRKIAPWWLPVAELASVLFGGLWQRIASSYLKKKKTV